jgi:hypothetical protein
MKPLIISIALSTLLSCVPFVYCAVVCWKSRYKDVVSKNNRVINADMGDWKEGGK